MNLLLFNPTEVEETGLLTVSGERAERILRVLKLAPGDWLRVGAVDGNSGLGQVSSVESDGSVTLKIGELNPTERTPSGIKLLIALPRPQILKKVLQTAAMFGAKDVVLFGCERVEKSYWSSKILRPEFIRHNLILGMEQGEVTRLPQLHLIQRFSEALQPAGAELIRLYADRGGADLVTVVRQLQETGSYGRGGVEVAIGPEGGWVDSERQAFEKAGFCRLGLGDYNLRVDVAVSAVLSQLELLGLFTAGSP